MWDTVVDAALIDLLAQAFPGEAARYFAPMTIGDTSASADEGAEAILTGVKTATSSAHWDYPDGRVPFVGALSVLLDGRGRARAIVETVGIETIPFGAVDEARALAYGEGERTLAWWRSAMGDWYRASAARHGTTLSDETPIIWEWIAVAGRL